MEKAHWLQRERESMEHARAAHFPDVKLIHYELARGYRLKAVEAGNEIGRRRAHKLRMKLDEQLKTAFVPKRSSSD